MSRIIYVNGRYVPYGEAAIHAEDRGFQFADSVYEVIEVLGGRLVDAPRHLARLDRSLGELGIAPPRSRAALAQVIARTIHLNHVRHGTVYLQVSRGAGPRDFALPPAGTPPTLVVIARSQSRAKIEALAHAGIAVVTMPDIRWGRSDIKSVMLLPACLAKNAARSQGAREAWLVDGDGNVTEGASSNAWIVTADKRLVTRPLSTRILAGVTRATTIDVAKREGFQLEERAFTVAEALEATEAFITSATNTVMPVVRIDDIAIGNGRPGPLTMSLRARFHDVAAISSK